MVKINIYGGDGHVLDKVDLSEQEPLNDPACAHPSEHVEVVEDNSGIEGCTAYQCMICNVGWLVKDKINDRKN